MAKLPRHSTSAGGGGKAFVALHAHCGTSRDVSSLALFLDCRREHRMNAPATAVANPIFTTDIRSKRAWHMTRTHTEMSARHDGHEQMRIGRALHAVHRSSRSSDALGRGAKSAPQSLSPNECDKPNSGGRARPQGHPLSKQRQGKLIPKQAQRLWARARCGKNSTAPWKKVCKPLCGGPARKRALHATKPGINDRRCNERARCGGRTRARCYGLAWRIARAIALRGSCTCGWTTRLCTRSPHRWCGSIPPVPLADPPCRMRGGPSSIGAM